MPENLDSIPSFEFNPTHEVGYIEDGSKFPLARFFCESDAEEYKKSLETRWPDEGKHYIWKLP